EEGLRHEAENVTTASTFATLELAEPRHKMWFGLDRWSRLSPSGCRGDDSSIRGQNWLRHTPPARRRQRAPPLHTFPVQPVLTSISRSLPVSGMFVHAALWACEAWKPTIVSKQCTASSAETGNGVPLSRYARMSVSARS